MLSKLTIQTTAKSKTALRAAGYIATRGANKRRPLSISIAAPSDLYCGLYSDLSDLYCDLTSDLYCYLTSDLYCYLTSDLGDLYSDLGDLYSDLY